ncbi:hypothetical protein BIT28_10725 [Photobacterium proteolyticum]|uniref:Pilin n=1 Tax=Photobacterium proteolyticum TaxID=1903952 RepID=A0A1Q9G6R5_9GAMM|nr:prepilin-type N-terminal cleavage/methylation domain-containing protein [Photobacterium proteolyticum]OLQ70010.1 hypothetical protein BIT28_10725 [Photobacterium proteolyticum]
MKFRKGFTLLEFVIVLIVLGIIAVTAAPRFLRVKDDSISSAYTSIAGSLRSAVSLFHGKWLVDGGPDPNVAEGRSGDWGYKIYNLHFNKHGYPRLIGDVQTCENIIENLLPNSGLTRDDYEEPILTGDGLDGNKCIFEFTLVPYTLTYSETTGKVTLDKRS